MDFQKELLCLVQQIIHLKRFQFFNGRWVKSQRSVTFPTENLEPLRYTVENGNGSLGRDGRTDKTMREPQLMQVEDLEEKQLSLKRPLTPTISVNSQPPAKRFGSGEEVEGQVKGQSDNVEAMDGSVGEAVEQTGEDGANGDVSEVVVPAVDGRHGSECEQAEPSSEPAVDLCESTDLLPSNMPKIYDLFATCVS